MVSMQCERDDIGGPRVSKARCVCFAIYPQSTASNGNSHKRNEYSSQWEGLKSGDKTCSRRAQRLPGDPSGQSRRWLGAGEGRRLHSHTHQQLQEQLRRFNNEIYVYYAYWVVEGKLLCIFTLMFRIVLCKGADCLTCCICSRLTVSESIVAAP